MKHRRRRSGAELGEAEEWSDSGSAEQPTRRESDGERPEKTTDYRRGLR